MRASRALAVTAVACAAVGLSAPLASAGGDVSSPVTVNVSPNSVHQGGQLTIKVFGCGHGGSVSSHAFPTVQLPVNPSGQVSTTARIHNHAKPGHYNLTVTCPDRAPVTHQFTVLQGRGALGGLGGSVGPSSTEMAIGTALVATAAVGGSLFIARRRRVISGKV